MAEDVCGHCHGRPLTKPLFDVRGRSVGYSLLECPVCGANAMGCASMRRGQDGELVASAFEPRAREAAHISLESSQEQTMAETNVETIGGLWAEVNAFVRDYVAEYELRADSDHKPNEFEQTLILDAITGLLAAENFTRMLAAIVHREQLLRTMAGVPRPDPCFQFREPGPWWFRSPDLDELEGPFDSREQALSAYQAFVNAPRRRS